MKENLICTLIGYLILAIVFLPVLVIKNEFWIGIAFVFFVAASIIVGQMVKPLISKYIRK